MFNLFSKGRCSALLTLLAFSAMNSYLMAWDCCEPDNCNRMYIGGFGGGIYSGSTKMNQMGTLFLTEAQGGPLAVFAQGRTKNKTSGFGGVQIGYEWAKCPQCGCSAWTLASAAELEAYFHCHTKKGHFINPTKRLYEHDFVNSFHMSSSVCLANAVFSLNNSSGFTPYIGGGIGATHICLHNAKSIPEAGINHFNSMRHDSSWAFAAQAKVGVRYKFCDSFHIFGEYRYLFVDSSNYIFGSTVYPAQPTTSPWNVKMKNSHYNAFAIGLQYDL